MAITTGQELGYESLSYLYMNKNLTHSVQQLEIIDTELKNIKEIVFMKDGKA